MSIIEEGNGVPSIRELRHLISIANDGFLLGWLVDLQESLAGVSDKVMETCSRLDDLKQSIESSQREMTEAERCQMAMIVRRIIAFNNKSTREKAAFDAVGLGNCAYEPDACLREVGNALRLGTKSKKRKK